MKRLLLLLVLSATLLSCEKGEDGPLYPRRPKPETADQTLMFYLGGQSLRSYFARNVREIEEAVDKYILWDSRLLIFSQSTYYSYLMECRFDYDTQQARVDTLRRYTYQEMTSSIEPDNIARILQDMAEEAPAKQYGLVLGSHGGGWLPSRFRDIDDFGLHAADPFSAEAQLGKNLLYKSPGADATRWFGEESGQVGEVADWAEGITASGVPFEYVIFDACFMSNVESLYELRHTAPQIVASPCEIMARGVPYHLSLPYLLLDQGREYDLTEFARSFHSYYLSTTETRQSGCLAITRTSELEALAKAMRDFNRTVTTEPDPRSLQTYEDLHDKNTKEYKPLFFDLRQYGELAGADEKARRTLLEQFDRTFPEAGRFHTPSFYSGYNIDNSMHPITYYSGITFSGPTQTEAYVAADKETGWYRDTH